MTSLEPFAKLKISVPSMRNEFHHPICEKTRVYIVSKESPDNKDTSAFFSSLHGNGHIIWGGGSIISSFIEVPSFMCGMGRGKGSSDLILISFKPRASLFFTQLLKCKS